MRDTPFVVLVSDGASDPNSCDTQTEEIPQENTVESAPSRPTKLEPIPPPPITDPNKAPLVRIIQREGFIFVVLRLMSLYLLHISTSPDLIIL